MTPPIFETCAADTSVQALLGDSSAVRLYPFGEAPQGVQLPYATWAVGSGTPENYLGQVPDCDQVTLHLDVFARTADTAREVRDALAAAVEGLAHVVSWDGEGRDVESRAYRISFTVDWIVSR